MKIVVVNENNLLLNIVASTLRPEGYEVFTADNALDANKLVQEEKPDLVILDLLVSYVTCYELIELYRSQKDKYIKIIIMTQVNLESAIENAFRLGVDDYIFLPLQPRELLARISRLSRYQLSS